MYGQDPPMPHPTPVITHPPSLPPSLPPPPTYLAMQSLDPNKICPLLCRFVDHSQPIHPHRSLKLVSLLLTSSCGNYCEKYSIFFFFGFLFMVLTSKTTSLEEGAIPTANEQRKKQWSNSGERTSISACKDRSRLCSWLICQCVSMVALSTPTPTAKGRVGVAPPPNTASATSRDSHMIDPLNPSRHCPFVQDTNGTLHLHGDILVGSSSPLFIRSRYTHSSVSAAATSWPLHPSTKLPIESNASRL